MNVVGIAKTSCEVEYNEQKNQNKSKKGIPDLLQIMRNLAVRI